MSSGDTLTILTPGSNEWPASSFAVAGYSAKYGYYLEYDATNSLEVIFSGVMPANYADGGLTLDIYYLMDAGTTLNIVAGAALQRMQSGDDLSSAVSWAENTVTDTIPAAVETIGIATITFTDGADMASVGAGDPYRLRLRRLGADVSDTATGKMRIISAILKET